MCIAAVQSDSTQSTQQLSQQVQSLPYVNKACCSYAKRQHCDSWVNRCSGYLAPNGSQDLHEKQLVISQVGLEVPQHIPCLCVLPAGSIRVCVLLTTHLSYHRKVLSLTHTHTSVMPPRLTQLLAGSIRKWCKAAETASRKLGRNLRAGITLTQLPCA